RDLADFVVRGAERERIGPPAFLGLTVGQDKSERGPAVPWNGEQASLNRTAVAAGGHDRQRLRTVALSKSAGAGLGEKCAQAAGRGEHVEALVAAQFEEMPIGVEQRIVPVDQYADWNALEQHQLDGGQSLPPRRVLVLCADVSHRRGRRMRSGGLRRTCRSLGRQAT